MAISKCAACERVFTSLSGFDAHQDRRFGTAHPVVCRDPATVGMVQNADTGRWSFPGPALPAFRTEKSGPEGGTRE